MQKIIKFIAVTLLALSVSLFMITFLSWEDYLKGGFWTLAGSGLFFILLYICDEIGNLPPHRRAPIARRAGRSIGFWRFIRENAWMILAGICILTIGVVAAIYARWDLYLLAVLLTVAFVITDYKQWGTIGRWLKNTGLPRTGSFIYSHPVGIWLFVS